MQINEMETQCDKENIQQLVEYFRQGCKKERTGVLGMEIEHFVVDKEHMSMVSYYGERGIETLLERLSPYFPENKSVDGHLLLLGNADYVITVEPAGQLEISMMPWQSLRSIEAVYQSFRRLITPVLEEWGYQLVMAGYCLKEKAEELSLIPKKRYACMNRYFEKLGKYGRCMMRGTASVQCSVDYYSEEDFVRTYRAAVALGPLFALVTDNAPVFEGKPWKKHMLRTFIWERVDKERCGIVPGTFEEGFGFEAYGSYLCHVPVIYEEEDMPEENVKGRMSVEQLEHVLSMVFPDVRLKQYIEIRVGDSMPSEYAMSYAALMKGLFCNRDELYELYKQLEQYTQFKKMTEEEVENGKKQLTEYGYDGIIYGQSAGFWLEKMIRVAKEQLSEEDAQYLQPFIRLVKEKKSVRDETKIVHPVL